jgi:malate dehydrogenase (oxaloacetate-decarboxylating)(NADP+)
MSQDLPPSERLTSALRQAALDYHAYPSPGKLATIATKPLDGADDLALAYSPGVAAPCEAIAADPQDSFRYTGRANLVAVITNGTAVLGLGAIGAAAAKPVMEGKAVLFRKFAGIDVFDLEIDERDPERLVQMIAALEPTFGGINLEDIKAPDCFEIERQLRSRMRIPVFHDDQHGTAIVVAAALFNGLEVVRKRLDQVKLVVSGAGAAAIACTELLVDLGLPRSNIWLTDSAGLVYAGRRERMDAMKARFAQNTELRTLAEVMRGADVFLGVSRAGLLTPEMVAGMQPRPLIFALANPIPEMMPEDIRKVRGDAVIATGRSDYPNQVNNVLCFPYIFRGALDVGATAITRSMEIATVQAIAALAREAPLAPFEGAAHSGLRAFGSDSLIPSPFDPRLIGRIAPAVARAAMQDGVARRPIDLDAYARSFAQWPQVSTSIPADASV